MKKIVIGFSSSKKFMPIGSWAIRLYQGGTAYSHCYIKLLCNPPFPSNKILHATEGQVSHYSETSFLKKNKIIKEFEIKLEDSLYKDLIYNFFHEKAGENYSILQNIGLVISRMLNIKNFFTEGWNCSEYAAYVLKKIYKNNFVYDDINKITPRDIYEFLEKRQI